jgi:adenylate cyclase
MAVGYRNVHFFEGGSDDGMAAAERALELDPGLAEAHAVKAYILLAQGDTEAAAAETAAAMKLDPESYEVNRSAGRLSYQLHRLDDAIRFFEKAVALMDADINSAAMLVSCYTGIGDVAGTRRAAELTLKRAEVILTRDPNNSVVISYSADALAALGEGERAKARMERALLIDPDNFNMRYNYACMLCVRLGDKDAALAALTPLVGKITGAFLEFVKADPDLELLHDDPRYQAMIAAIEARLSAAKLADKPVEVKA